MTTVSTAELHDLTHAILGKAGFSAPHIDAIYNHLLYNEFAGRASHGFVRIKWTLDYIESGALHAPDASPLRNVDMPAFKHIDGQGNIGILAALEATQAAIEGAKTAGAAWWTCQKTYLVTESHHSNVGCTHLSRSLLNSWRKTSRSGYEGTAQCGSLPCTFSR